MRKSIYTKSLLFFAMLMWGIAASAQQARVQLIHNAADITLDTVDVYINDQKLDNVAFRTATGIIRLNAGVYVVSLNDRNSIDSGDLALVKFNVTLAANSGNVIMVAGVADTTQYATNPEGRNRSVRLIHRRNVVFSSANSANVSTTIIHGSTDAPGVNLTTRPASTILNLSNVRYGDTTNNLFLPATSTYMDVVIHSNSQIFKSYLLPLNGLGGRSVVAFASGFVNPSANQNGEEFGLFVVDTNGGNAIAVSEACRLQVLHNAIDTAFRNVDVWLNGIKAISNLAPLTATPTISLLAGLYDLTVTRAGSATDTSNVLISLTGVNFDASKNYLGIATGVLDTNMYETNPSGINRSFSLAGIDSYTETGTPGNVRLWYFNGVADADSTRLRVGTASPTSLFANTAYGSTAGPSVLATTPNTAYVLREEFGNTLNRTFRLRLPTAFGGRVGLLFSSGYATTANNPDSLPKSSYYIAFTDGSIVPLQELNAFVQIIHTSADTTLKTVDVYLNDALALDDFGFAQATPFLPIVPYKNMSVKIAPSNSASSADAFFTTSLIADSSRYHYAVATGVRNPANYLPNPDGVATAFTIIVNNTARPMASMSTKNVDLMYFHSMTDGPITTSIGQSQTQFLSKDDRYRDFHGYRAQAGLEEALYNVVKANTDTILFSGEINLSEHQGDAGLVFATGFVNTSGGINQGGPRVQLYIAWPDGDIDTFTNLSVGLRNPLNALSDLFKLYPNPVSNELVVDYLPLSSSTYEIAVYDVTGKQVYTETVTFQANQNQIRIPVSEFEQGAYIINIQHAQGSYTQRFVKTN